MEGLMAWATEDDTLASTRCGDLLPERSVLHVLEFMGVMHFAWHVSRATVFALPSVETIEHVGTARGPHGVRQSIDCRTQLRKLPEILQSEDLDLASPCAVAPL
jgi:hypothetical protein